MFNFEYHLIFLEPGNLQFEKRGYLVKESCGNAEIGVLRQNGADGIISVKWRTIDKSAINGKDYVGGEGEVKFGHGEVSSDMQFILSLSEIIMIKGIKLKIHFLNLYRLFCF